MKYEKYDKAARVLQSPIPFWFLNGHLDRWHIQDELDKMKAIGVTTVIPHPRAGLAPEYLSEEFFDLMGIIIEECKKLFLPMARTTGTLWEHWSPYSSLNHAFEAVVAVYLDEAVRNLK